MNNSGGAVVDRCSSCEAAAQTHLSDQRREAAQPFEAARQRAQAALAELLRAGAPGRVARKQAAGSKLTLSGRRTVHRDVEPAWAVGGLRVHVSEGHTHGAYDTVEECGLTRTGIFVLMDPDKDGHPILSNVSSSWAGTPGLSLFQARQVADRLDLLVRRLL